MCSPDHDRSTGFAIGSDFSHCPRPGTMRDYLNPPLIHGWLDSECELIFRVSPPNRILSILGVY